MRAAVPAGVLLTASLLVPALATPALAQPQVLYTRSDERGAAVGVSIGGAPVAGASIAYADPTVCAGVGLWTECTPLLP